MKVVTLFSLLSLVALGQPVVSNVRVFDISHSSATVAWSNSVQWNAGDSDAGNCRIRYGATTSYEGGALGGIQSLGNDNVHSQFGVDGQVSGCQINLYTLKTGQLYHICPQTSVNGSTWSACVDTAFTTLPKPDVHPVLPVPPATFSVKYPDTTAYTKVTVASDCSDLQARLSTAAAAQPSVGTVIQIPVGTECAGTYTLLADSTVKTINTSLITTSNNTFRLPGHGYADRQAVRLAVNGGPTCTGGIWTASCGMPGRWAILPGTTYYINPIDADRFTLTKTPGGEVVDMVLGAVTVDTDTETLTIDYDNHSVRDGEKIQFRSTGTLPAPLVADTTYCVGNPSNQLRVFTVAATCGGAAINLTAAGSGEVSATYPGNTTLGIMVWPPTTNEIIIRSAAPDSQLPPEGTRITPEWSSKMATFIQRVADSQVHPNISTAVLSHDYRIGPGIELTVADTSMRDVQTTDPGDYRYSIMTYPESYRIGLDRFYVHPRTLTTRQATWASWNGSSAYMINGWFDHMNYWHGGYRTPSTPTAHGMTTSFTPNTISWTAGTLSSAGVRRTFAGNATATFNGGGVTGIGCVWFAFDGKLTFELPPGVSLVSLSGYPDYVAQNTATPRCPLKSGAWPQFAGINPNHGVQPFEQVAFTAGAITAVTNNVEYYQPGGEGTQMIIAGLGPGPYLFHNNYVNATGIPIHFDDSTGYLNYANSSGIKSLFCAGHGPADITVTRNLFTTDKFTIFGKPGNDGNRYYHRNAFEVKNGLRGLLAGNIIERQFADVAFLGTGIVIQAQRCGKSSNWEVRHNTIRNSSFGALIMGAIPTRSPVGTTVRNLSFHNNLIYGIDSAYEVGWLNPVGASMISANYGGEDFRIEHNTSVSPMSGVVHFKGWGWEGFRMASNFIYKAASLLNAEATSCSGVDKELADCMLLGGTGTPNYEWVGNIVQGTATTLSPTSMTTDPKFVDPLNFDFRPKVNNSPLLSRFKTSKDGRNVGADMDAVLQAQGAIQNLRSLNITADSAAIAADVPDAGAACIVGYGPGSDVTTWSRSGADSANGTSRTIALTGLAGGTVYNFQLWCAGTAAPGTQQFRTR